MQTCFLAPHMAELRLSGATLLSVVGMSNSATAGGATDGTTGDTSSTAGPGRWDAAYGSQAVEHARAHTGL